MRRIFPAALLAASVLLGIALAMLWHRSYRNPNSMRDADSLNLTHHEPLYWLISRSGNLSLCRQVGRNWDNPYQSAHFLGIQWGGAWGTNSSLWNLEVPYAWLVSADAVAAVLFLIWMIRQIRKSHPGQGQCVQCGYDIRASPQRCPECGTPVAAAL